MEYKVKRPKVKLNFNHILTSCVVQKETKGGIIIEEIIPYQVVVAAGENAMVKVGDVVEIDPSNFQRERIDAKYDIGQDKYRLVPPVHKILDNEYMFISDRNIKWIYEDPSLLENSFKMEE